MNMYRNLRVVCWYHLRAEVLMEEPPMRPPELSVWHEGPVLAPPGTTKLNQGVEEPEKPEVHTGRVA